MKVEKNNAVVTDNITRNDLVDYLVTKRVGELNSLMGIEISKRKSLESDMKSFEDDLDRSYSGSLKNYIDRNYKDTLSLMKDSLGCDYKIIENIDKSEYRYLSMGSRGNGGSDSVIIFDDSLSQRGRHHPDYMFMAAIRSFIRISRDSVKDESIDKIRENIKELKTSISLSNKIIANLEKEISKVKSQRDVIKNTLIEEFLSSSTEGQSILDRLNSLDLGIKLMK